MGYHWNWLVFAQPVPTGETTFLGWLLAGLRMTLLLSAVSWVLALALGTAMGVLRAVPSRPLRAIAAIYVETFRNLSFGTGAAMAYILALATLMLAYAVIRTLAQRI